MSGLMVYALLCSAGMIIFSFYATKWKIAAREAWRQNAYMEQRYKDLLKAKHVQFIVDNNLPKNTMYMLLKGDE